MLSTLMIRGALLPLMVVQQRNVAGMAKIKPQLDDLGARLKEARPNRNPNPNPYRPNRDPGPNPNPNPNPDPTLTLTLTPTLSTRG